MFAIPIRRCCYYYYLAGIISHTRTSIQLEVIYSSPVSIVHRADLIVVMFDAHKLDISDELKIVIDALRPHHDKTRYNHSIFLVITTIRVWYFRKKPNR